MPRPSELHGSKLHDNKEVEELVIKWILDEPKITDYEISQRLNSETSFSFSPPTVASWRNNFFMPERQKFNDEAFNLIEESKKAIQDFEEKEILGDNLDDELKEIKKTDLASGLVKYLGIVNKRIDELSKNIDSNKDKEDKFNFNSKQEEVLRDYLQIAVGINEKLLKHASETSPGEIISDSLQQVVTQIFYCFPVSVVTKPFYEKFKTNLKSVEKLLQNKYILKIKK